MAEVTSWSSTFESQLCCCVWFTRTELEQQIPTAELIQAQQTRMVEVLEEQRRKFLETEQIEAIVVKV
jgi:hypothetical protein